MFSFKTIITIPSFFSLTVDNWNPTKDLQDSDAQGNQRNDRISGMLFSIEEHNRTRPIFTTCYPNSRNIKKGYKINEP